MFINRKNDKANMIEFELDSFHLLFFDIRIKCREDPFDSNANSIKVIPSLSYRINCDNSDCKGSEELMKVSHYSEEFNKVIILHISFRKNLKY